MKKYYYIIFISLTLTSSLCAQQVFNTEFKTKTLQVFQNLDKNRVPHGILLDFGMEFTNLQAFNGTLSDSTYTTSQTLSDVYKTLLMCRVRSNVTTGFITPQEYATRWYSQRSPEVLTLSGQYFKYNRFADNAYPNKVNYSNNKFSDKFVNSVWQNPYEEKQLFAMAPSIVNYKGLNFQVKLPSNLFLSNYPALVQSIHIDFGDGLGYRIVTQNQLVNVAYTQANTYTWKYKLTLTNGAIMYNHSKIKVEGGLITYPYVLNSPPTSQANQSTQTPPNLTGYAKTTIIATVPYGASTALNYGKATVYIRYRTGGNNIFKPLIVAEGLDDGIILKPEQEAGTNNIEDFLDKIDDSNSLLELESNFYDIIYVDWNNGVDFIQKNAYALEEVIKWVNIQKANAGSTEQNVVLGQSMGGLVARYALRDIELNRNFNHDTRLYISHDSPHLGANVPLSVQYSARHLRNLYVNTPIPLFLGEVVLPIVFNFADGVIELINNNTSWTIEGQPLEENDYITPLTAFSLADTPAARQMQYNWINRKNETKNFIHESWQQELSSLGHPVGYPALNKYIRNISIANGSECGVTQIDNGNIMSYIKDAGRDTFLSNYIGLLDAVIGATITNPLIVITALFPGKSYWEIDFQSKYMTTLNQSKNIYHGSIKYKKKVFYFIPVSITVTNVDKTQPPNVLPYDIYGGGWQRTNTDDIPVAGSTLQSNAFGFIPTASSLDIGSSITILNDTDYRKSYVGALPPLSPKNSPFQNFITHFDQFNQNINNSSHISFNTRNGNWLRAELINSPVTTNCSDFCTNTSIVITGSKFLCASGNYSVTSEATTVTWSITSGNSLVTLSNATSTTATLTPTSSTNSGNVTLAVTYGNDRCGFANATLTIWVGKPKVTNFSIIGASDNVPTNSSDQFNVNYATEAVSYDWTVSSLSSTCTDSNGFYPPGIVLPKFSNGSASYSSVTPYSTISWGNCSGTYLVNCKAVNTCGFTAYYTRIVNVYGPGGGGGGGEDPCLPSLQVYPNPVNDDDLVVNLIPPPDPCGGIPSRMSQDGKNILKVYDMLGNLVYTKTYNSLEIRINDLNLKRGHYILNVFTSSGKTNKEIIIVE